MKNFPLRAIAPLTLALVCGHVPAHAKDSAAQAANRRAIVAVYDKTDRAIIKKDFDTLMYYIAPEARFYAKDGSSYDRATYDRITRTTWSNPRIKITDSTTKIVKWEWRGPDAIVWTRSYMRAVGPGGAMTVSSYSRDYWGKISQVWQLRQIVTLTHRVVVNGEVISSSSN